MGCCLSTLEENKKISIEKTPQFSSCVSKSPPRPEEETVKEVLSETPKPKPKPKPDPKPVLEPELNVPENGEEPKKPNILVSPKKPILDQKLPILDQKLSFLEKKLPTLDKNTPEEEISEVSELCSLSESISNTTLDEHHPNAVKDSATSSRVYRSQGQNRHFHTNNNINNTQSRNNHGRSPARRADPSPPRRRYPGPGPGSGPAQLSGRRSRSPAARANVGRSPSGRRAGPSPGRVRMVGGPEGVRKVEEESVSVSRKESESEEGVNESLENPLVSLECFIFL
ncbi:hypothetical protein RND81_06G115700 [Saponaria officinalis]|uniref:Uncharacterized protein n=1 Tax=Saponaria officinalis TaxID=3572 RepID=A0AAW1KAK7_SAPOF